MDDGSKYGLLTLAFVAGLLALYVMLTPKGQALLTLARTNVVSAEDGGGGGFSAGPDGGGGGGGGGFSAG